MAEPTAASAASKGLTCTVPGCGQVFRRRDYLARHEAMHTDARPYPCDLCGKAFGRSDVLTRHRKKCPAAETRHRSISPYSPSRQNEAPSRQIDTRMPQEPRPEFSSILGTLPNIESRLPLVQVTSGPTKRKHDKMAAQPDQGDEEDSMSDISVESLVLNERAGVGRRGDSRGEGSSGDQGNGGEATESRRGRKQSRRMPILDVDFPTGPDGATAAASNASTAVDPRLQGYPSSHQAMPAPPAPGAVWSDGSPLDMSWLGDFGNAQSSAPNFESFLPDTFFDFEAFLSSTLGETSTAMPAANFLTSAPNQLVQTAPNAPGTSAFGVDASVPSPVARVMKRIGSPTQAESAYHVPVERFRAYYHMSHWDLPHLAELVTYAERTRKEILPHFGFLHQPTFRLDMFATCLAFSLCVIGANLPPLPGRETAGGQAGTRSGGWDLEALVRMEMTTIIMKVGPVVCDEKAADRQSFSVTKRMTMSDYNMALNQSLLLLQASDILSEHSHERMRGNMFRTSIVNTARQLECYNPRSSHFRQEIRLPVQPWTFAELDLHWRRWIQLEVRRRTTYFIFIFDMLATIETSIPCICGPAEVCYIPLPAPSTLWDAPGSESWLAAARSFKPISLDGALRVLFTAAPQDAESKAGQPAGNGGSSSAQLHPASRLLDRFAMHVVVLMLLRGVIEIGEGRRERGDWYDLTDLWLDREEADQWIAKSFNKPAGRRAILETYTAAIQTWRTWWDALPPSNPLGAAAPKPHLCEDALPIFWLVQALLGVLASSTPVEVRRAFITRINFAEMLNSARTLTRENRGAPGFGPGEPGKDVTHQ